MKSFRRVVTMVVAASALVVGAVFGLTPVQATLTQLTPQLRTLTVSCGNGYLTTTPPARPGDLVALPDEAGVFLPKADYLRQCASAVGWHKYAAWGLTVLGVLGLATALAGSGPAGGAARDGAAIGGGRATGKRQAGASAPAERTGSDATRADAATEVMLVDDPESMPNAPAATSGRGAHAARAAKERSDHVGGGPSGGSRGAHRRQDD